MGSTEPAAKRRRISPADASAERAFLFESEYVTLAKTEFAITPFNPNSFISDLETAGGVMLSGDDSHKILISKSTAKPLPDCVFAHETRVDAQISQILEDCDRLAPAFKCQTGTKAPPLACYYAAIRRVDTDPQPAPFIFTIRILWRDSAVARDRVDDQQWDIWNRYFPEPGAVQVPVRELWDPRQFYENVHVPDRNVKDIAEASIDLLQCKLYPFQQRAVRWLLSREGVAVQPSGQVAPMRTRRSALPAGFLETQDADGRVCYVHHALGVFSTDILEIQNHYQSINGGILAEEMGLGKTVELLALICLHMRKECPATEDIGALERSRATLIITPPTILEQWKQEIREHAPGLKVYHYEGLKSETRRHADIVNHLVDHDVVLTTYNTIAKEVHYVEEKPDRNLRGKPRYEPPKSPLTQISWWRVCLDEAQMVESGVSSAAIVARLIPRVNAWAVSGTPLKKEHKDLYGLLLFLRYKPWGQSLRLWNRLVDFHRPLFRSLMSEIAIRHSKEFVREDLRLPPQTRHTITIPFTAIEEQYYAQLFSQMCEEVGLDAKGAPLEDEWDPNSPTVVEAMRQWLTRLRQTCLHPEVGGRNRKALGRSGGPLRSVFQVLEVMIDQNDVLIRAEQRAILLSQTRRGQMMENAKDTKAAMEIWQASYQESCKIVSECRAEYDLALAQRQQDRNIDDQADTEDEDEGAEGKESDTQLTTCRQRLRSALEVQHICIFFIANAYFQLKSDESAVTPDSDEFKQLESKEEAAYEEAKSIRSELLSESLKKANRFMNSVRTADAEKSLVQIPHMSLPLDYSGIESRKVFEKLHHYCEAMNKQGDQYNVLRQKMVTFLQHSLIDEDEGVELKGDEYENSTKHQDEMYAYMEALRALFADRSDAVSGQQNVLIRHEMKQLLRSAKEGEGPAPELMMRLLAERQQKQVPSELGSLRGIVSEIRHLATALQWQEGGGSSRARAELAIANEILQHCQKLINVQTKAVAALEQEVTRFRDTMNNRLEYYRALQKISDTVAPHEEENMGKPIDVVKFNLMLADEDKKSGKLSSYLAKRRYLLHLKGESSSTSTPRICTICQCEFEIGTLTVCGHQFCKECIHLWYHEHKNCPICKKRLKGTDFWDITYKPAEMAIQEESPPPALSSPGSGSTQERSMKKSIYSDISTSTLNEIKDIDLDGSSFGSKVDTICRHLLWLRYHDPGSKAIIFSQYREFLDVLGRAFRQSKIGYTRFDEKNGIEKFKSDPAMECFLLHAKAHSAGLNLVIANHVFLCEPLINTAIELQAIARVHRIGQQRATTVWMYLVADSVEEAIYEISVTRRLAHMKGKAKAKSRVLGESSRSGTATPNAMMESAIDAANSLELQAADLSKLLTSGKSGGEVVSQSDLWQCLFGRVRQREAGFAAEAAATDASGEIGRFLRADAAEGREKRLQKL